jgi:hypothetical protein
MHLDILNEEDVRGLEINSVLFDQAEEITEDIKMVMEARVGRWDKAVVPPHMIAAAAAQGKIWPTNKYGRHLVPNRFDVLCNPNEAGELHWIYRDFHPESIERKSYCFFIERETDESLGDAHTMQIMRGRDKEWVDTYYRGVWGKSSAQIHSIGKASVLNEETHGIEAIEKLLATIKAKAALTRVLDHGETGITCCTWWATINKVHICFQEYYVQGQLISRHRQNISDWSDPEGHYYDYADPDILKKHSQKDGAFNTVALQYQDRSLTSAPPLFWAPADNNEFATRDRINQHLEPSLMWAHPITGETPAPGIYFIQRSGNYPKGAWNVITQTKAQKRLLLGSDNGKNIYSEERDPAIVDHAYDTLRYFVSTFAKGLPTPKRKIPRLSIQYYRELSKRRNARRVGAGA